MIRTGEWYFSGYCFLEKMNPKLYKLSVNEYMEGMYTQYILYEVSSNGNIVGKIGPDLYKNHIKDEWTIH